MGQLVLFQISLYFIFHYFIEVSEILLSYSFDNLPAYKKVSCINRKELGFHYR